MPSSNTLKELTEGYAYNQLKQVAILLNDIGSLTNNLDKNFGLANSLLTANKAAIELKGNLAAAYNTRTQNLDLNNFNKQLIISGKNLSDIGRELGSIGITGNKAFGELTKSIMVAEKPLIGMGKVANSLWNTLGNTVKWQASSLAIQSILKQVQSASSYVKQLDSSLNNIQIVTNQSTQRMAEFAKQANLAAKELNTTTNEYTKASLIYYQQGLDNKSVMERANTTIKLANVSGQSAKVVSDQLTAVWNNFYDGSKNLEFYADAMAALGATTASSSSEIAKGLEKFAAIGKTTGLSFEYASSALATVVANTRLSADSVGTSFRTLFSRLQGLSLGETLDDGTTLNKYSNALLSVGVNIKKANGDLKTMDAIIDELGEKWQSLAQDERIALAQTVGGVRNYTGLMSLMDNFDDFTKNLKTAQESTGTLQRQQDIYAKSWEAASAHVRAASETIYSNLLNDSFMKNATNAIGTLLDGVGQLTTNLNGFRGSLLAIGAIGSRIFADKLPQAMGGMVANIKSLTPAGRRDIERLRQEAQTELLNHTLVSEYAPVNQYYRDYAQNSQKLQEKYQKATESGRIASYEAPIYQQLFSNLEKSREQAITETEKAAAQDVADTLREREATRAFTNITARTKADFESKEATISPEEREEIDRQLRMAGPMPQLTEAEYAERAQANRQRLAEERAHGAVTEAEHRRDEFAKGQVFIGQQLGLATAERELASAQSLVEEIRTSHGEQSPEYQTALGLLEEAQTNYDTRERAYANGQRINARNEQAVMAARHAELQVQGKPVYIENTKALREMVTNGYHYNGAGQLVDRTGNIVNQPAIRDLSPYGGNMETENQMFQIASNLRGNMADIRTTANQGQNLKYMTTRLGLDKFNLAPGNEGTLEATAQQILQFTSESNANFLEEAFKGVADGEELKSQLMEYGRNLRDNLDYSKDAAPLADQIRAIITGGTLEKNEEEGTYSVTGGDDLKFNTFLERLNTASDQRLMEAEDKRLQLLALADRIAGSDTAEGRALAEQIRSIVGSNTEARAAEARGVSDEAALSMDRLLTQREGERVPIGKVLATSVGFISHLGMAANSVSGALQVFKDETATTGQKLGAVGTVAASVFSTGKYLTENLKDFVQVAEDGTKSLTGLGKGTLGLTAALAVGAVALQTIKAYNENYSLNGRAQTASNLYAAQQQTIAEKENNKNQLQTVLNEYNTTLDSLRDSLIGSSGYYTNQATLNTIANNLIDQHNLVYGEDYTIKNGTITINPEAQEHLAELVEQEYTQSVWYGNILAQQNRYWQSTKEMSELMTSAQNIQTSPNYGGSYYGGQAITAERKYEIEKEKIEKSGEYKIAEAAQQSAVRALTEMGIEAATAIEGIDSTDLIKSAFLNDDELEKNITGILDTVNQATIDGAWGNVASFISARGATGWDNLTSNEAIWSRLAHEGYVSGAMPQEAEALRAQIEGGLITYLINSSLGDLTNRFKNDKTIEKFASFKTLKTSDLESRIERDLKGHKLAEGVWGFEDEAYESLANSMLQEVENIQTDLLETITHNISLQTASSEQGHYSQNIFKDLINNYSLNELEAITGYVANAGSVFGHQTAQLILKNLSGSKNVEVLNRLSKVNWDSTFSALGSIDQLARNIGGKTNIYSDILQSAIDDLGREGGLFKQLYEASGFQEVLASLTDQFNLMGEISINNVTSLAKKSTELNSILKLSNSEYANLNINAAGLTSIFNAINSGVITANKVSSQLISSLSTAGALDTARYTAFDITDNQDLGRSGTELLKFFSNAQQGYLNAKSQNLTYDEPMRYIFEHLMPGQYRDAYYTALDNGLGKSFDQIMDELPDSVQELLNHATKKKKNSTSAQKSLTTWSDIIDFYGEEFASSDYTITVNGKEMTIADYLENGTNGAIKFENGNIFTGYNGNNPNALTTDLFTQLLTTAFSEGMLMDVEDAQELAKMFVGYYSTQSGGRQLEKADAWAAVNEYSQIPINPETGEPMTGKRLISEEELHTQWLEYGKDLSYGEGAQWKNEAEFRNYLLGQIGTGNYSLLPSTKIMEDIWKSGTPTLTDIGKAYMTANGYDNMSYMAGFDKLLKDYGAYTEEGNIDLTKLNSLIELLGGNEYSLTQLLASGEYSGLGSGKFTTQFSDKFGNIQELTSFEGESHQQFQRRVNRAEASANSDYYWDANKNDYIYDPLGYKRQAAQNILSEDMYGNPTVSQAVWDYWNLNNGQARPVGPKTPEEYMRERYPGSYYNPDEGIWYDRNNEYIPEFGWRQPMEDIIRGNQEKTDDFYEMYRSTIEGAAKTYATTIENRANTGVSKIYGDQGTLLGLWNTYEALDEAQKTGNYGTALLKKMDQLLLTSGEIRDKNGELVDLTESGLEENDTRGRRYGKGKNDNNEPYYDEETGEWVLPEGQDTSGETVSYSDTGGAGIKPTNTGPQGNFRAIRDDGGNVHFVDDNDDEYVTAPDGSVVKVEEAPAPEPATSSVPTGKGGGRASGQNNNVLTFAAGKEGHIAVTGELGPELRIKEDGTAELLGKQGREYAWVEPGDRIYTATQTAGILGNNNIPQLEGLSKGIRNYIPGYANWTGSSDNGPTSGGGDWGGGGGEEEEKDPRYDPNTLKIRDILERYYTILQQLNVIAHAVEHISKVVDRGWGQERIKAIQEQTALYQKQYDAQVKYVQEIRSYTKTDKEALTTMVREFVEGYNEGKEETDRLTWNGAEFDENGVLTNYKEFVEKLVEQYNANAEENAKDKEAQYKFQEQLKDIQFYTQSLNLLMTEEEKLYDLRNQILDNQVREVSYRIEYGDELDNNNLRLINYELGKVKDNAYEAAEAIALIGQQSDFTEKSLARYEQGIWDILKVYSNPETVESMQKAFFDDPQAFFTEWSKYENNFNFQDITTEHAQLLEQYMDTMISDLQKLQSNFEQTIDFMGDNIKEFSKTLDKEVGEFDYFSDLQKNLKSIIDLTNRRQTNIDSTFLAGLSADMLDNSMNKMKATKRNLESMTSALREAQSVYQQFLDMQAADTGEDAEYTAWLQRMVDKTKKNLDTVNEQYEKANKDWLQSWEDALSKIEESYKQAVEEAGKAFEESFSPFFTTLDLLQAQFDREKKLQDLFVDDYQRIHDLSKLNRDIEQSILDTDNLKSKSRLRDLQKEINQLQADGTELSEYDLDILDKKYKLELARQALEDAKDAKSLVRLSRDNNGNWGYVYTSNEDEVAEAEQNYEDAIREMEEANENYIANIQDQIVQVQQEAQQAIQNLKPEDFETYEDYLAAVQNIQDSMMTTLNYLRAQLNGAFANQDYLDPFIVARYGENNHNLTNDFGDLILSKLLDTNTMDQVVNDAIDRFNKLTEASGEAFTEYSERQKEVWETAGYDIQDAAGAVGEMFKEIADQSNEQVEIVEKVADRIDEAYKKTTDAIKDQITNLQELTDHYETFIEKVTEFLKLSGEYVPYKKKDMNETIDSWEEIADIEKELAENKELFVTDLDAEGKQRGYHLNYGTTETNNQINAWKDSIARGEAIDVGEAVDTREELDKIKAYLDAHGIAYVNINGELKKLIKDTDETNKLLEEWLAYIEFLERPQPVVSIGGGEFYSGPSVQIGTYYGYGTIEELAKDITAGKVGLKTPQGTIVGSTILDYAYQVSTGSLNKGATTGSSKVTNAQGCFAPGTQILMSNGNSKNIEDIQIGEIVIAYDEEKQDFVPKKVTKSYIHHNTPKMVRLTLSDHTILELTPGHPLYSTNGWKSLDIENSFYEHNTITTLLRLGDELININHNAMVISIEYLNINPNYDSYNIEVEDCHTFLANGFVAHNRKSKLLSGGYTGRWQSALSGMYTGEWPMGSVESNGRWALLHQKELVLNAHDTENFLSAMEIVRQLDNLTNWMANGLGNLFVPNVTTEREQLEQNVHIDASFPNVQDHREIEMAFDNIVNLASQYANRK